MNQEQFNKTRFAPGDRMTIKDGTDHLISVVDFERGLLESNETGVDYHFTEVERIYYPEQVVTPMEGA